ncbi:uncharacterized protein crybg2 [Stigmatopora nigra]
MIPRVFFPPEDRRQAATDLRSVMAKKTFSKKSFKNLFSRSDPNLDDVKIAETKTPGGSKKFIKLPKWRIKSKGSPEKNDHVFSPTGTIYIPVDGPRRGDDASGKTDPSIYATAPRSKGQELSYSETDLHKPNKFATFSFSLLKKKKRKKDEKLSSSTFGLDSPAVEEKRGNFGEQSDEDGNRRTLSASQPALDTSDDFDIPSPPSTHSNLLNSYFAVSRQRDGEPRRRRSSNGSDPVLNRRDSPHLARTAASTTPAFPSVETVPRSNRALFPDSPDPIADDVIVDTHGNDGDLRDSNTEAEITVRQRPAVVSYRETDETRYPTVEPDDAGPTLQRETILSPGSVYLSAEEPTPERAENSRKTSTDQKTDNVDQDVVYGALYGSLFPRSFTSEILPSYLQNQTDLTYSGLSTSSFPTSHEDTFSSQHKFSSYNTLTTSEEAHGYHPPTPTTFSYSEDLDKNPNFAQPIAGSTFYNPSVYKETHTSNSAPLIPDDGRSQGTDTRITSTRRRAILLKEVAVDDNSAHSGPVETDEVTARLENRMDAHQNPPEITEARSTPRSPVYLSIGSDDGSNTDVYFSAEEDDAIGSIERTYVTDKIEEETDTKWELFEPERTQKHFPDELLQSQREEFKDPLTARIDRPEANYGTVEEIQFSAEEPSRMREEELPASPVPRVTTASVCEFATPSTSSRGEGTDETRIEITETAELHQYKQPFGHDAFYPRDPNRQSQHWLPSNPKQEKDSLSAIQSKGTEGVFIIPDEIEETGQERTQTHAECVSAESSAVEGSAAEHDRLLRKSEWVDTITTESAGVQPEQVELAPSDPKVDAREPERGETEDPSDEREHRERGSNAETPEALNANTPKTNVDDMNSGYSSLSVRISAKNSPPDKTEQSRYQFRKLSGAHGNDDGAGQRDAADFNRNGTEHGRKNAFDGVSRFSPRGEPPIPSHGSTYRFPNATSSSYGSSLFPEATSYGYGSQMELGRAPKAFPADDADESGFSGVFRATLVELDDSAAAAFSPPESPDVDVNQSDMDDLVDTLKNMGPSLRPRSAGPRGMPPVPKSALAPIVEDSVSPVAAEVPKKMETGASEARNGLYGLPADLGLRRNTGRDTRSPLELMKKDTPVTRDLPVRASVSGSMLMRQSSSDASDDHKSINGTSLSPTKTRLDNSSIFGSYRTGSVDQTQESHKFHRSVFRSGSLPDLGSSPGLLKELGELGGSSGTTTTDSGPSSRFERSITTDSVPSSRFERLSFLLKPTTPPSSFTAGSDDHNARMSLPRMQNPTASAAGPSRLLGPAGPTDNHRSFLGADSASYSKFSPTVGQGIGTGALSSLVTSPPQRSFGQDSILAASQSSSLLGNNLLRTPQIQKPEPERNVKYRAFPDAYLTKEKEHGKLNPRPGKMYIFDRPGLCGQRIELRSDVVDATAWELQETISIRVVRGGWVLYEKRNFKGEKVALDEGDIELTCPFKTEEDEEEAKAKDLNGQKVEEQKDAGNDGAAEDGGETKAKPARKFIIGSVRRAVRDYSVPEISLFPEENAEGKKVIFRDTSEDARIFGFPIKANSIIINAGLWLVYAKPFFEGSPRILEVGGYSNPAAWGVEQAYVGSVHPLKVGEPRVENISEPKIEIYERSYFTGKSRMITTNMRDFITRVGREQGAFMYSVGALKVHGGIWVGYEKEGYRGHQYLLEEGEYHDWRVWGGVNAELRSVRLLQGDLSEPLMVMFEQPEEEEGPVPQEEENTFEVNEAIPDVELFDYKINTRSIQVFGGIWVAYSHVDFSGNQFILEKGFYSNCADWGSRDTRICSVQPVRLAPTDGNRKRKEIVLYSEPAYKGKCLIFNYKQDAVTEEFQTKSCRVVGGSWVLYENKDFTGITYVLSEGGYSSLISMGCQESTFIRSIKAVPTSFSVPSISLFGLEGLEGREITTDSELLDMTTEGFNDHVLSVRVNSGCWVVFEFGNYRGRQFLLEPIEIPNWPKFSSIQTIGSMYPVRQKRQFFRIRNADSQHLMSVQGGVDEMKSGRVVASPQVEQSSDIWFYQDGLLKNKLCPTTSLQVMGNVEPAAKLVLWTETRQPSQTWVFQLRGRISSIIFPGVVIDVKGGQSYDKEHVVVMPESDERLSQQWEIVLIN